MAKYSDPCPSTPCEWCHLGRPVNWEGTNFEWCQEMDACAASIDWEALYQSRSS